MRPKTVSGSRSGSLCAKHRFRKGERTLLKLKNSRFPAATAAVGPSRQRAVPTVGSRAILAAHALHAVWAGHPRRPDSSLPLRFFGRVRGPGPCGPGLVTASTAAPVQRSAPARPLVAVSSRRPSPSSSCRRAAPAPSFTRRRAARGPPPRVVALPLFLTQVSTAEHSVYDKTKTS
jgi:hypothetical protein